MKITELQVHEAFYRAMQGESVRSLARGLGVDESSLRERFKKGGTTPKQCREIAFQLFYAEQAMAGLSEADRLAADILVLRARCQPDKT
jgi:hypothetical protein